MSHKLSALVALLVGSVLAQEPASAAPLDGIWVSVPATLTPTGSAATDRVSVRSVGTVPGSPLPQYFVRITYDCGGGMRCTTPELTASPYGPGSSGIIVGPISAPAPRQGFVLFVHPACTSAIGAGSVIGAWANAGGTAAFAECFWKQPPVRFPGNPNAPKRTNPKQIPLPTLVLPRHF